MPLVMQGSRLPGSCRLSLIVVHLALLVNEFLTGGPYQRYPTAESRYVRPTAVWTSKLLDCRRHDQLRKGSLRIATHPDWLHLGRVPVRELFLNWSCRSS